jgi:hypothetical protein
LDIEIDSKIDFSSEDDEPLSSFVSSLGRTYHSCIKCPDFAEYVGVLGKVKNNGDEMAPQDGFVSFWRTYHIP